MTDRVQGIDPGRICIVIGSSIVCRLLCYSGLTGVVRRLWQALSGRAIRVVRFDGIADASDDRIACERARGRLTTLELVARLRHLARSCHCITLEEYLWYRRSSVKPAPNLVLLTADGCGARFYHRVYPLLKKHGIPAAVFLAAGHLDSGEGCLTRRQVREMHRSGLVAFGSYGDIGGEDAWRELLVSKGTIEAALGVQCFSFAYPGGDEDEPGPDAAELLRRAGYEMAFAGAGRLRATHDVFSLPRSPLTAEPMAVFSVRMAGGFDLLDLLRGAFSPDGGYPGGYAEAGARPQR